MENKNIAMLIEKQKLIRKEKRLLGKLKSPDTYKGIIKHINNIFNLNKKFLVLGWWYKKIFWIISITSFYFLWKKIGFIDDFIVNRKLRGKWVWKKIFSSTINQLDKENNNYVFLLSKKERTKSHNIYKKFWFTIVTLWIWILAYKKFRKK